MTLNEAKEQIAKNNQWINWETLVCNTDIQEQLEYTNMALVLVLSFKDKEIAELKASGDTLFGNFERFDKYASNLAIERDKLQSELSQR